MAVQGERGVPRDPYGISERALWLSGPAPSSDIVLSTRVRLARNLRAYLFPPQMEPSDAQRVVEEVERAVPALARADGAGYRLVHLDRLSPLDRQVLVEKHLISPQHARGAPGTAVVLREDEVVSIMVNEEDHVRIQCLLPGFQVERAWELADRIDDVLQESLEFAYDERLGFLTCCPTNVGTGLRASVMMHLPGLMLTGQAGRVFGGLGKVGVVVRGLYGEGTEAKGNIFQVSNQITLGPSERDIVDNLITIARQLMERERSVRERLYREQKEQLEDRVWRAYGLLTHARVMSSDEAIRLLSDVKLGIDLNILPHVRPEVFTELLVATRPAMLQKLAGETLDARQRDLRRAALIRQRLARAA